MPEVRQSSRRSTQQSATTAVVPSAVMPPGMAHDRLSSYRRRPRSVCESAARRGGAAGGSCCLLLELPRRSHLFGQREGISDVDDLAGSCDFPQAIFGGVIAECDVSAGLEAVPNHTSIFAIVYPIRKATLSRR